MKSSILTVKYTLAARAQWAKTGGMGAADQSYLGVLHSKITALMFQEHVIFDKTFWIQEKLHTLTSRQFALE